MHLGLIMVELTRYVQYLLDKEGVEDIQEMFITLEYVDSVTFENTILTFQNLDLPEYPEGDAISYIRVYLSVTTPTKEFSTIFSYTPHNSYINI